MKIFPQGMVSKRADGAIAYHSPSEVEVKLAQKAGIQLGDRVAVGPNGTVTKATGSAQVIGIAVSVSMDTARVRIVDGVLVERHPSGTIRVEREEVVSRGHSATV